MKLSLSKLWPGWLPGRKFFLRILSLTLLIWVVAIGIYFLFKLQSKLNTTSTMGAAFGAKSGIKAGEKQRDKGDLSLFDTQTHLQMGGQFLEEGDAEKALYHFFRAELLERDNAELTEKMGDAFFLMGDFVNAEKSFADLAKDMEKIKPQMLAKLGLSILLQNRIDEGIAKIEKSLEMDSTCGECYGALGRALSQTIPERKGAVRAYFKSMVYSPSNPHIYYHYARYLMKHKRYTESQKVLKHLIDISPLYGKGHARLGIAHYYLGEYKKSINHYEVALKINPADYNTHYNLGEVYYNIEGFRNVSQALKCYLETVNLNREHEQANFRLGLIYIHNKQYKEAARHLETAHASNPKSIKILLQLGVSYEKLGRPQDALYAYKRILQIDALNRIAKQKINIISHS